MNLTQSLLKYWQSRTYSPNGNQDTAPILRVRLHSTTAEDKHPEGHEKAHGKAHDSRSCDCGRTPNQFETLRSSLADRTTGRVNLDWIPGELLYD